MLRSKIKIVTLLSLINFFPLFSQYNSHDFQLYKNEIGIDVAYVLTFLQRNNQSYLINYKRYFNDKSAFRFGGNLSLTSDRYSGNTIGVRLGQEMYLDKNMWRTIGGIDFSYSYDKKNYQTKYLNIIGVSPLIGVKFFFSKQFSIGTECKLNFMYSMFRDPEGYYPEANKNELNINIGSVGMIVLCYHFNFKRNTAANKHQVNKPD